MDGQIASALLHEVGPKWFCVIGAGVWLWRCTPWLGKQIEKLVDEWIAERNAKRAPSDSTGAK